MSCLEGGLHGLKADSSARADDQDCRHGADTPGRTRPLNVPLLGEVPQARSTCQRMRMMVIVTSDGLDRHRPVIGMKSYGEKADRKKAGMEQGPRDRAKGCNTSATSCSASISCSFELRLSVTNQMTPALRSGRASSGRARRPPANCVVSMQTPTFSMMSQTRSRLACERSLVCALMAQV